MQSKFSQHVFMDEVSCTLIQDSLIFLNLELCVLLTLRLDLATFGATFFCLVLDPAGIFCINFLNKILNFKIFPQRYE